MSLCLGPLVFKENIEGAHHIHVSMDSDASSGFIRNPSVSVFISKMGSQWASIDTTLVAVYEHKGALVNRRFVASLNYIEKRRIYPSLNYVQSLKN